MKFVWAFLIVLIGAGCFAAGMQFRRPVEVGGCDPSPIPAPVGKAYPDGQAFADQILAMIGLPNNITVYMEPSPEEGRAEPQYRRIYLATGNGDLYKDGKIRWKVAFVIAHEIGHVLNQNDQGERDDQDSADEFAGWAMRRFGASLPQLLSGVVNKDAKIAITKGWKSEEHDGEFRGCVIAPAECAKGMKRPSETLFTLPAEQKK